MMQSKAKIIIVSILSALVLLFVSFGLTFAGGVVAKADSDVAISITGTNDYATNYTGNITLKISISNPSGLQIVGGQLDLYYDSSAFTYDSCSDKSGWSMQATADPGGNSYIRILFMDNSLNGTTSANFALCELKFTVASVSAQEYSFTPQNIKLTKMEGTTATKIDISQEAFKVSFHTPSSDTTVSSITVKANGSSGATLAGTWSGSTYSVTNAVEYTLTKVNIAVSATSSKANVSGVGDKTLSYTNNVANVKFTVTAEDGTSAEYTVKITRAAANTNTNATLVFTSTDDSLSIGQIALDSATLSYEVSESVPYALRLGVVSAAVTPSAGTSQVNSFKLNGNAYTAGSAMNLEVGANTLTVSVVSQGSAATSDYTVVLNVTAGNSDTAYKKIYISDSSGNELSWDSGLSITLTTAQTSGLTLHASAETQSSKVLIDGEEREQMALSLKSGSNKIEVQIVAEDGASETYTVTVTVMNAGTGESDYSVDLKFYAGGVQCTLRKSNNAYYATFNDNVTTLKISVTTSDETDDIFIAAYAGSTIRGVAGSGEALSFSSDMTEAQIQINRTSGETLTYRVVFVLIATSAATDYIVVGGDVVFSISQSDFVSENFSVIEQEVNVGSKQDSISFYLDVPENVTVESLYGATAPSVSGLRYTVSASSLTAGNNTIILRLEDKSAGISKLYVLNVVKAESGEKTTFLVMFIVFLVLFVAAACVIIYFVLKYIRAK